MVEGEQHYLDGGRRAALVRLWKEGSISQTLEGGQHYLDCGRRAAFFRLWKKGSII